MHCRTDGLVGCCSSVRGAGGGACGADPEAFPDSAKTVSGHKAPYFAAQRPLKSVESHFYLVASDSGRLSSWLTGQTHVGPRL